MATPTTAMTYNASTITLQQIAEGNNSSEYLLRTATQEFRLRIRHSKEKAVGSAVPLDRHNVELSVRTFATATVPAVTETSYFVARTNPDSDGTSGQMLIDCLSLFTKAQKIPLTGWITTF